MFWVSIMTAKNEPLVAAREWLASLLARQLLGEVKIHVKQRRIAEMSVSALLSKIEYEQSVYVAIQKIISRI